MTTSAQPMQHRDRHRRLGAAGQRRRAHADTTRARELRALGHTVEMITPRAVPHAALPDLSRRSACRCCRAPRWRGASPSSSPDAIHIATEGPLGLAARRFASSATCRSPPPITPASPNTSRRACGMPLSWTYAFLRWFHEPSRAVMAPTIDRAARSRGPRLPQRRAVVARRRPRHLQAAAAANRLRLPERARSSSMSAASRWRRTSRPSWSSTCRASKWVVGDGPALAALKRAYPERELRSACCTQRELAQRLRRGRRVRVPQPQTDTFGLVLLEAMACGLPVAAYPVTGPLDVIGDSKPGVRSTTICARPACAALEIKRAAARAHARKFSWAACAKQFADHLRPVV